MTPHATPGAARIVIKALLLLIAISLIWGICDGTRAIASVSAYNRLFAGRKRFPFGENPRQAYNLTINSPAAMLAAHEISAHPKPAGERWVWVVGDSSVWGTLLQPEETLAGQLDALGLTCDGDRVRFFNLGYPTISLFKDILIMDAARETAPDAILWLVTLEAFPRDKQITTPLVENNLPAARLLAEEVGLKMDFPQAQDDGWQRSLFMQRRNLADLARLQLYGVLWDATGIDQDYPQHYTRAQVDLTADARFHGWQPDTLPLQELAFDVLDAGMRTFGQNKILLVNEPVMISGGKNSGIRYNAYYPRWAYDRYREEMARRSLQAGWEYLDAWDWIPAVEFTNSAIHLTPTGVQRLSQGVIDRLLGEEMLGSCSQPPVSR